MWVVKLDELSKEKAKKYKRIRLIIQIIVIALVIAGLIFLTIKIYPIAMKIQKDESYRNEVLDKINSYGSFSWAIILGAQVIQTVLAIIPSGPIVMISGMLYNPFLSVVLCVLGQTIGAVIVFYLVKLLGVRFIALMIDPDMIKNSKLLRNETKTEVLMFGYYLVPALPKDIIAFVAPFTKIKIRNFIIINLIARIPMTIVTVLMGSSIINGSYALSISLAVLSGLLALLCFIFNNKIVKFIDKLAKKEDLCLIKLNKRSQKEFNEMMEEWYSTEDIGDNYTPYAIFKNDYKDFDNYIKNLEVKEGNDKLVPDSVFFLYNINENKMIGAVNIRHVLNDYLLQYGGHIGDGIRPSERGKGYGNKIIELALIECKKLGIKKVLMTCDKNNIPSKKAIIHNGGILENEVEKDGEILERYWIDLK